MFCHCDLSFSTENWNELGTQWQPQEGHYIVVNLLFPINANVASRAALFAAKNIIFYKRLRVPLWYGFVLLGNFNIFKPCGVDLKEKVYFDIRALKRLTLISNYFVIVSKIFCRYWAVVLMNLCRRLCSSPSPTLSLSLVSRR